MSAKVFLLARKSTPPKAINNQTITCQHKLWFGGCQNLQDKPYLLSSCQRSRQRCLAHTLICHKVMSKIHVFMFLLVGAKLLVTYHDNNMIISAR